MVATTGFDKWLVLRVFEGEDGAASWQEACSMASWTCWREFLPSCREERNAFEKGGHLAAWEQPEHFATNEGGYFLQARLNVSLPGLDREVSHSP